MRGKCEARRSEKSDEMIGIGEKRATITPD
jgi:hypothetical protein